MDCRCIVYMNDGDQLVFEGNGSTDEVGLFMAEDGVEGWYGSPDLKTSLTEMSTGDGSHDVLASNILYASRVITLRFVVNGRDRDDVVRLVDSVGRCHHKLVRFRFVDDGMDTFVTGMCNTTIPGSYGQDGWLEDCSLTVTCPDPCRYSWDSHVVQLFPLNTGSGLGLEYTGESPVLAYPLSYGGDVDVVQNVATLTNMGSSVMYPVITVNGGFDYGVRVDCAGGSLQYTQPIGGVPLVLDSRTRTASMGGADVTRHLSSRGFPAVPAHSSVTVSLQASGTGWVTVESRDTYV